MLQAASDAAAYGGAIALARHAAVDAGGAESEDPVSVVLGLVDDVLTSSPPPGVPQVIQGDDPVEVALAIARRNLPPEAMGTVLKREDVELGIWDPLNHDFVPTTLARNAIRVTLRRAHENGNPEPTFLARLAGFDLWDIAVQSTARTFISPRAKCVDPVLTARTRVDIETNNVWVGICVHAKANVAVDTSSDWLSDAVVGLVDRVVAETLAPYGTSDTSTASSDLLLGTSVDSGSTSVLDPYVGKIDTSASLDTMLAQVIVNADVTADRDGLDFTHLVADATYHVVYKDYDELYIPGGVPIRNMVILSDCPVRVDQNAHLESTVIISNLAALRSLDISVQLPTGLFLGSSDDCGPGDGVRVMVFVDAETAARFAIFDPELFPLGDLYVAAQRKGGGPDSPVDASLAVDLAGEFLTGTQLQDLLGICVGAEYMLEVNAFAMTQ